MQIALTQSGVYQASTNAFLQVGHTHEDIDGIFAICARAICAASDVQTPMDLKKAIDTKLERLFTAKGLAYQLELVDTVS